MGWYLYRQTLRDAEAANKPAGFFVLTGRCPPRLAADLAYQHKEIEFESGALGMFGQHVWLEPGEGPIEVEVKAITIWDAERQCAARISAGRQELAEVEKERQRVAELIDVLNSGLGAVGFSVLGDELAADLRDAVRGGRSAVNWRTSFPRLETAATEQKDRLAGAGYRQRETDR